MDRRMIELGGRLCSSTPGRGDQDHPSRGRGAAMETMAVVSPYVETRRFRTLGAGSFGSVVLASEPRGDAHERSVDVALKVSRAGGTMRKKILREAAFLRKVARAKVVRLIDVRASTPAGERDPDDLPILASPQADVDLQTFLGRRPRGVLPPELARRMMRQLAAALAHVHAHDISYCDTFSLPHSGRNGVRD